MSCAFDGDSGLECALGKRVALVVLDLMLPGRPGLEILTELAQRRPGLPVIVLTARGQLEDRVEGLDAGAADYLVKPFMLAELEARIRAQLRSARQAPVTEIRTAGLELNLLTRQVLSGGCPVRLSNTEFELLLYLMRNPGTALSRERSCAPCGVTHTIRARTSSTCTSVTCAASSAPTSVRHRSRPYARSDIGSTPAADRSAENGRDKHRGIST